ncbi:MAG TPA: type III-A CRISPR-associated RAMP protein Csm3 [Chloroflexia bacterium]|nr:type III-A CRISPR-associated RAMP protein Csm3 [Chloroflexia bacterium]
MADTQAAQPDHVRLLGRIFLTGDITLKTGLHIGGAASTLSIGGVDNQVIRDTLTGRPYIPGSSLRGKMRSLSEKFGARAQNFAIGQGVRIHVCKTRADYDSCEVCQIFGVPGELESSGPTRLIVRDVFLTEASAAELAGLRTDLPFTEIKWEAAIDRVTSAATPRQMERVPAGAVFGPFELVYSLYQAGDAARFANVVRALKLLEDDYLGGQGSRGSGQIAFANLQLRAKRQADYNQATTLGLAAESIGSLDDLLARLPDLLQPLAGG